MQAASDVFISAIADAVYQRIANHLDATAKLGGDRLTYSEAEAAELLGVPKHVLKGARERGEISPAKIGKGWRYSREVLAKFANGNEIGAAGCASPASSKIFGLAGPIVHDQEDIVPTSSMTQSAIKRVAKTPEFYRRRLPFSHVIELANERAAIHEFDAGLPREYAEQKAIRWAIDDQGVPLIVDSIGDMALDVPTVIQAFDLMCRQMANVQPTPELIPIFISHGFSPQKAKELSEAPVDEDIIHREIMQRLVAISIREQLAAMDAEMEVANA